MPSSRKRRTAAETKAIGIKSPLAKELMKIHDSMASCETKVKGNDWRWSSCKSRQVFTTKCHTCQKLMHKGTKLIRKMIKQKSFADSCIQATSYDGTHLTRRTRKRGG